MATVRTVLNNPGGVKMGRFYVNGAALILNKADRRDSERTTLPDATKNAVKRP